MIEALPIGAYFDTVEDVPAPHMPIQEVFPTHFSGPQVKARRAARSSSGTRWCATCNTTLDPTGKAKFCAGCAKERNRKRVADHRIDAGATLPADVQVLSRLHSEAKRLSHVINNYLKAKDAARDSGTDFDADAHIRSVLGVGMQLLNTVRAMPEAPTRHR